MSTATASKSEVWTIWSHNVVGTWIVALIFAVLPAIVFGIAIMPVFLLAFAAIFFVPVALIQALFNRKSLATNGVRIAIILVTSSLSLAYAFHLDAQIPGNAEPITRAIEAYKLANGHYPDSIEALIPSHLERVPSLISALHQPRMRYRTTKGTPYLIIDSSSGDAFAHYEYNFASRAWLHRS